MPKFKHLTLSDRISIELMLKDSFSFKAIAKELQKDCTSISKEIKNHITVKKTGSYGRAFNNCSVRLNCSHRNVCQRCTSKNRYCSFCSKCSEYCSDYKEYICPITLKPPYVCNGCSKMKSCTLAKSLYIAANAQKEYALCLSESRIGINIVEEEIARLNGIISPLILKGQSIHHISVNNRDQIMHSEKSIYNYINYNLFSARNIDLPRKVSYRPRKKSSNHFKVDRSCRIGRSYEDFLLFMHENPDTPVVEMDTVEGPKGGKVLLTIHFTNSQFMLAFLRDSNTSRSVIDIFDDLYWILGPEVFSELFPIILTDNGSEFSNPLAIEFDKAGNRKTYIFYCNPSAAYQKGAIENNHEFIRRFVPKGQSFNSFQQEDIALMMSHINSYKRKKLNDRSPHAVFSFLHSIDTLNKLNAELIPANNILLSPKLFKQ